MICLDTDHLTALKYPENPRCAALADRVRSASGEIFTTTAVNVEEQVRGWLAQISQTKDVAKQVPYYEKFVQLFTFFSGWRIVPFDERAADTFKLLRQQKVRIGTMDLKIAAITLVQDAKLLSANWRDFRHVPGLDVENWLQ